MTVSTYCFSTIAALGAAFKADAETAQGFASYSDSAQMLSGLSRKAAVEEIMDNAAIFSLQSLAPRLAGKSVLLIAADADEVLSPENFHDPMVAAYEAESEIDLNARLLSGDHSYSWTRVSLIREVLTWAQDCRRQ